ncbi:MULTISPECIES: hypothetical protein [Halobacterium]|uniref:Uncharacterized protein n=4 Tax=Halobacterium salinarum TaxID=2242 RepID=Q9HP51_HALSA|nr:MULTISPECIES: hypothetical protein [Halobacterium]AAG20019.1 hypothetical protein VNG_1800H [Halobacterium salinarum NRC-1]MBB6089028.1 hypothetical protein [Halobacterium salinarum]MCF2164752.1 hypothetical protein [Halobacterium salinarum]MCF2167569.1 hypothetical protein [Halobacterium salinarum]MCF2207055.1 hypothetical protein [Halobacterium salinarum]
MSQDYRLVSTLVRAGDSLPCPAEADPVVQPTSTPGLLRVTYLKEVTRVPFAEPTRDADVAYVE